MKRSVVAILSCFSIAFAEEGTVSELLDEAQTNVKFAIESNCDVKAPYYCAKARTYYEIAKEEVSKLHMDLGEVAAKKAIHWALKAIAESNGGSEK